MQHLRTCLIATLFSTALLGQQVTVRAGTLLDGKGGLVRNTTLVIAGSRIVKIVSRSRTPNTASTERATCLSPTRSVTKRSVRSLGDPKTAPKSTTGVGIPRMIDTPRTNDGTPEIGSTASGRIVSMTCVSGTAQTQLLSPTMRAFLVPAALFITTLFLRLLLHRRSWLLPYAESSELTPRSCRLRLKSRQAAQLGPFKRAARNKRQSTQYL